VKSGRTGIIDQLGAAARENIQAPENDETPNRDKSVIEIFDRRSVRSIALLRSPDRTSPDRQIARSKI
jgi:hypothetical protein